MSNTERDAMYLREFAEFGSYGPETVAGALLSEFTKAQAQKQYDRMSHFQIRLHAEMVLSMEIGAAHLYAYSRWDTPKGILGTLVSYQNRELKKFIKTLLDSEVPINILRLPKPSDLHRLAKYSTELDAFYSDDTIKQEIRAICGMLNAKSIRDSYNRIKHASVYTRHTVFLNADKTQPEKITGLKLLHPSSDESKFDLTEMPVIGDIGIGLASQYAKNVTAIMNRMRGLAEFVAYLLDNNLMKKEIAEQ